MDEIQQELAKNLDKLGISERYKKIVAYRFGFKDLTDSKAHTLEETGKVFKITRERVRQIVEEVIAILKSNPTHHE